MECVQNGMGSKWNGTKMECAQMEYDQNGMWYKWNVTKMESYQNGMCSDGTWLKWNVTKYPVIYRTGTKYKLECAQMEYDRNEMWS